MLPALLIAAIPIASLLHGSAPAPPATTTELRRLVREAAGCDRLLEYAAVRVDSRAPAGAPGASPSAETTLFAVRAPYTQTVVRFDDGSRRSFGFDGTGWAQGPHDSGPLDPAPSRSAERAPWADACRFSNDGTTWSEPRRTTLDGYAFDAVTVEPEEPFLRLELLFEVHSHLLVARYYGNATTIYTDYRRVDGIPFAFESHSGSGAVDLAAGPSDAVSRVDAIELFRTFPESDIVRPSRSLTNTEVLK